LISYSPAELDCDTAEGDAAKETARAITRHEAAE
jgi:hypothetical protein